MDDSTLTAVTYTNRTPYYILYLWKVIKVSQFKSCECVIVRVHLGGGGVRYSYPNGYVHVFTPLLFTKMSFIPPLSPHWTISNEAHIIRDICEVSLYIYVRMYMVFFPLVLAPALTPQRSLPSRRLLQGRGVGLRIVIAMGMT